MLPEKLNTGKLNPNIKTRGLMKNRIYKYLGWSLIVLNFLAFGILITKLNIETDRLDYINKTVIPTIAEKSYSTGCTKDPSEAIGCKVLAKVYRNEMVLMLGLE